MRSQILLVGSIRLPRTIFLFLILSLFGAATVQANNVVIGTGSGFITVSNMNGLNAGDSLSITSGQYSGAAFNNLNGITITNNGGTVVFNGQVTLNTLVSCTFSGFQFKNVPGISIRWDGNSRRCLEKNISFSDCAGNTNDASDHNVYNGDTSSLKLYMCTFDSLTLFRSGMLLMGGWGEAKDLSCYMDSIIFSRIKIDSTLGNGNEVRGIIFRINAHDWKEIYKGTNTGSGDIGMFFINGNGSFHNIYRFGGRGYIIRLWNVGLKTPGNTYFYNNIDLNSSQYGSLDTRVDPVEFTQYTTGGNCYIFNNTAGNKEDHIGYWSSIAVVGTFSPPWVCQTRNNLAFNLQTHGKPPITMNQSSNTWISDSSNNMYFVSPDSIVDPITCVPFTNSPVLGKGLTLAIVQDDYYHNPRTGAYDIGAVQHGGPPITPPPNQPPVVIVNATQSITLPVTNTILDGTKSYDPDGNITSYAWTLVSGPAVNFSTDSAASTIVTGLTQGIFIFKLTATDNSHAISSALDTIIVNPADTVPPVNVAPVANAGPDQAITAPLNSVTLNGSSSYDPDGSIKIFSWITVSGPGSVAITNAATANPAVQGLTPGVYVFELSVTDNSGASSTDQVEITVYPEPTLPNQDPVANAGVNLTITAPVSSITLNGTSSFDPDGTIVHYDWSEISGPNTAGITNNGTTTPTVTGLIAGVYTIHLLVTDNDGATDDDQITVTVNPAVNKLNQIPVAMAGADTVVFLPATTFVLNASGSYDPDGNIISYHWQEISGPNEVLPAIADNTDPEISNLQTGSYIFQLTVTDNENATSTAQTKITVEPAPGNTDQLLVYPNPSVYQIHSRITTNIMGTVRIQVYNMTGQLVISSQSEKSTAVFEKTFQISSFAAGMYTIQVNVANQKTMVAKFIKN